MRRDKRMSEKRLWRLRQQIPLNSLYVADYHNDMGFTPESVRDFFDSYMSYLSGLMDENGVPDEKLFEVLPIYDTPYNLKNWWGCYEQFPLKFA